MFVNEPKEGQFEVTGPKEDVEDLRMKIINFLKGTKNPGNAEKIRDNMTEIKFHVEG